MAIFAAHPDAVARVPRALAYRYDALPLSLAAGTLSVALPDPDDAAVVDALRAATRLRIRPCTMPRDAIREGLHAAYGEAASRAVEQPAAGDAPAVRAVDLVLTRAASAHASDVHIDPSTTGGQVRFRIDGVLRDVETIPADLLPAFVSRVKLLAGMDIADRRAPQDGRCAIPFEQREIDARVASVPTIDGEKLVIRLLDGAASMPDLVSLGMPATVLERYLGAARAPWGFVVVAGPTGSGKTTTLYASLACIDSRARSVCSVEDPVEMRLPGVAQVHVNPRAGVTFPLVLRAFMRQDPNVVMVGEMRDGETAAVAASAALAGQLVFATLHANDAPRTIDRLIELGVARHSLAAALTTVVAQRLVRTLCEQCRRLEPIPVALRSALETALREWYVAGSCRACGGTGYIGRTGVYELMEIDDATRDAVATGASSVQVGAVASQAGYRPMRADAFAKVLAGTTSFDEVARVLGHRAA